MHGALRDGHVKVSHQRDHVHHAALLNEARGRLRVCEDAEAGYRSERRLHGVAEELREDVLLVPR